MEDNEALLRAVVENPDDDAPRLAYADHREACGDADRAEFIRVQCELTRRGVDATRRAHLLQRQAYLLSKHRRDWLPTVWSFSPYPPETWSRGFVSRVEKQHGRVSREDGISLAEVPTIESLSYGATWADDEGFGHLPAMPNLREFFLWGSEQLTDGSFALLAQWPTLVNLALLMSGLTDSGMTHLSALKQLRSLTIDDGIETELITDAGLTHLRDLSQLEEFRLTSSQVTGQGFAVLAGIPSLRKLSVGGCGLTEAAISTILSCVTVEELDLSNYIDAEGIGNRLVSQLSRLPRLKALNAIRRDVSANGFTAIEELTALEELHIGSRNFGNDQLGLLLPLRRLRRLCLAGNCFGPTGLHRLREFSSLRALQLCYQFDGGAMEAVAPLGELRWLDLDMNPRDETMTYLRELKSLEFLRLRSSFVTDTGLARVGCLPKLRYLRAESTSITKEFAWDRRFEWAPNLEGLTLNGIHYGQVDDPTMGWQAY